MTGEKRFNMGPVPTRPEYYLNEQQVNGMSVLRKFGWTLVCIRRPSINEVMTIMKSRQENALGVLGKDGILRVSSNLKIRRNPIEANFGGLLTYSASAVLKVDK